MAERQLMAQPVVQRIEPSQLASYAVPDTWPRLSADEIASHAPDASFAIVQDGTLTARCSLWWQDVPPYGNERLGVIGHYGAASERGGLTILQAAVTELAARGCTF